MLAQVVWEEVKEQVLGTEGSSALARERIAQLQACLLGPLVCVENYYMQIFLYMLDAGLVPMGSSGP